MNVNSCEVYKAIPYGTLGLPKPLLLPLQILGFPLKKTEERSKKNYSLIIYDNNDNELNKDDLFMVDDL